MPGTLYPDPSLHQPDQLGCDRQTESGTAEAARHRGIALLEWGENYGLFVRGNATAGVGNHEMEALHSRGHPIAAHVDFHPSHGGELDRVAHQVDEDLPQA